MTRSMEILRGNTPTAVSLPSKLAFFPVIGTSGLHPRSLLFQREPVWRLAKASALTAPHAARSWLAEAGSLTARLKKAVGPGFGVCLLGQCWARPFADEAKLLELPPRQRVLVREVL
ncbi:MAG: chorismate--pyruvate lyase family protein, partial [Candidatus Methylumidiphilus sp.]